MNCEHVQRAFLDRDMGREERRELQSAIEHLQQCASCRAAMDDYDMLRETLASGAWPDAERRAVPDHLGAARRPGLWRHALALAAGLLLGLSAWLAVSMAQRSSPQPGPESPLAGSAPLHPSEVATNTQAFAQVAEVFEKRSSWLLVANGDSSIGLADAPMAKSAQLLVLRLTLMHDGRPASSADLMIVAGQNAHVKLPLANGRVAEYRVSTNALESGRLHLWAELNERDGASMAVLATSLLMQDGQESRAGELATTLGGYELRIAFARSPQWKSI